ncbi:MAG: GTPase SAR1 family protein [Candidatus Azotimanducaceae bacterium]
MQVADTELTCVIWDIAGEDEFYTVTNSYLRGMAGFFLVVDSTRNITLRIALNLLDPIQESYPDAPFIVLVNKSDLIEISAKKVSVSKALLKRSPKNCSAIGHDITRPSINQP